MAFQYQYQYQYQYGYQVQPGYQTYLSFYQMLHDVPLSLSLLSLVVVAVPFLLYLTWRRGYLGPAYSTVCSTIAHARRSTFDKAVDVRVKEEYTLMVGKKTEPGNVVSAGGYLGLVLLGIVVIKKMLFFSLVLSESMVPALFPADLVFVEAVSKDVNVGDIIMFQPSGEANPIIHRVVGFEGNYVLTKGDASLSRDDWRTPKQSVIGKAVIVSGSPVIVKNLGWYLMPRKIYVPGSDPTLEFVQDTITFMHEYGILVVIVMVLFALITSFEGKGYGKVYEA